MTANYARQPLARLFQRLMHALPQLLTNGLELGCHATSHRPPKHDKRSLAGSIARVREPQEVERLRLAFAPPLASLSRIAAKLDHAGLVGVQFQVELLESLLEFLVELPGVRF